MMSNNNLHPLRDALSEREQAILRLLAEGLSDRQIAQELFLSLNTVKWYNRQIYSKLGASSRTHLPPFRTKRVLFPVPHISDKAEQEEAGRSCADIIVENVAACFGQSPVLEAYSEAIGVGIVLMLWTKSHKFFYRSCKANLNI
jgi:DNA-binding CsgD family transcriptional regulator